MTVASSSFARGHHVHMQAHAPRFHRDAKKIAILIHLSRPEFVWPFAEQGRPRVWRLAGKMLSGLVESVKNIISA
jgi:hypothetical protein